MLEAVGFTWDQISMLRKTIDDWKSVNAGKQRPRNSPIKYNQQPVTQEQVETIRQTHPNLLGDLQHDPKREAKNTLNALQAGNNELTVALDRSKETWTDWYAAERDA